MKNKTVLITGGTSGIGLELVKLLRANGNTVVVLGRSKAKLDELGKADDKIQTYVCDLSQRYQIEEAMDRVVANHPDLLIVINNAAIQLTPTFIAENFQYDGIALEITTNLTAPLWITSLLLSGPLLRQPQSRIVNISSGLAFFPKKESAVYCATKAALHSFSQSLRYQLEGTPVGVTEVFLPLVDTPMTHGRGSGKLTPEEVAKGIIDGLEKGRDEIYLGKARMLPLLMHVAPSIVKNILKRH